MQLDTLGGPVPDDLRDPVSLGLLLLRGFEVFEFTQSFRRYPYDIPPGTAIPRWAFFNVTVRRVHIHPATTDRVRWSDTVQSLFRLSQTGRTATLWLSQSAVSIASPFTRFGPVIVDTFFA